MPSPPERPDSAIDRGQQRRAERRAKRAAKRYDKALAELMRLPAGQIVIWTLLGKAGTTRTVTFEGFETNRVMFHSGRQDFGFKLLADLVRVDPDAYVEMERAMRQAAAREIEEERAARTPTAQEQAKAETEGDIEL